MTFWINKFNLNEVSIAAGNEMSATVGTSTENLNSSLFQDLHSEYSESEISMFKPEPDKNKPHDRNKYINYRQNGEYVIQSGDNPSKIAKKFNVEVPTLLSFNNITDTTKVMKPGVKIKIPPTRTPKNIKTVDDAAAALGVSKQFIKSLKFLEDGFDDPSKFHNEVYDDASNLKGLNNISKFKGNPTIGIGHLYKKGEKASLSNEEVLELFVKDLMKVEEQLWGIMGGQENYEKLPQSLKEALLDMVFNKGINIISKDMIYRLKNGKYEAAINCITNNKDKGGEGKELSGLSKRRLFDLSVACKMYNGKILQSNINIIQKVYDRGIELLRKEYPNSYKNILIGFNKDVKRFFGDDIKNIKLSEN